MVEQAVPQHLLRLPFDHFGRYRLAAEVLEAVGARTALDVGGGPGSLAAFVPDLRVVASDRYAPSHWHAAAPSLVLADGAALPFADGSFDVVVTLDTLEHVPPEHRPALLREAVRVSSGWVLVVCPCATPGVPEADAALLSYVRHRFGEDFSTVGVLQEHLGYGHPDPAATEAELVAAGAEVVRFPSGRLDRWLPMMVLFFHLMALGRDDPVERVQAWYNDLLYRDDLRAPSYRQAFLARVPGAAGPPPAEVVAGLLPSGPPLADPTVALQAVQAGLTESLTDLVAEHRERGDRAEAERDAARAEVQRLTERLQAADAQVAALLAFRDRVLNHPVVRLRTRIRRGLGT